MIQKTAIDRVMCELGLGELQARRHLESRAAAKAELRLQHQRILREIRL